MGALLASMIVIAFLCFGLFIALSNWVFLYLNWSVRRNPERRHFSPMALITQLIVFYAAMAANVLGVTWIPSSVYWGVALVDISLLQLLLFPFVLIWTKLATLVRKNA